MLFSKSEKTKACKPLHSDSSYPSPARTLSSFAVAVAALSAGRVFYELHTRVHTIEKRAHDRLVGDVSDGNGEADKRLDTSVSPAGDGMRPARDEDAGEMNCTAIRAKRILIRKS